MSKKNLSGTVIGVFTAARSDLGPLSPVIESFGAVPGIELVVIATGAHFLESRGRTIEDINLVPRQLERIPVELADSNPHTLAAAFGPIARGVADVIARRRLDAVVVLGDRWEILPVASAALIFGTPLAHLHGGEVTAGAIDDRIRHAVSKLSDLHCCATEDSARRLRQIGEPDDRIIVTGAPGLDRHSAIVRPTDQEVGEILGTSISRPFGLVAYHPETVDRALIASRARLVLEAAVDHLATVLVTFPGVDPGAEDVIREIERVGAEQPGVVVRPHIGRGYSSVLASIDVMIGNSSSGIWEAASFRTPVVDVGDRQAGRLRPENVIHSTYEPADLERSIRAALDPDFRAALSQLVNPYGDGMASSRVVRAVIDMLELPLGRKAFVDR